MLQAIDDSNLDRALELLRRGFPKQSQAFWLRGIERSRCRMSRGTGWPLGYLLHVKERSVGVLLTFARHRARPAGGSDTIVNLSSWYVEPSARIAAPLMLKKVMAGGHDMLTDLSPSHAVAQMLPPLGFSRWNEGVIAMAAPEAMAGLFKKAAVMAPDDIPAGALSDADWQLLSDHDRLGCLCAGLYDGAGWHPLVFAPMQIKGVRTAYLMFARSRRAVLAHRGAVAWHLMKRGMPVLCMDADAEERVGGCMFFAGKRPKYFRGNGPRDCTDYSYSELVFLGPDGF